MSEVGSEIDFSKRRTGPVTWADLKGFTRSDHTLTRKSALMVKNMKIELERPPSDTGNRHVLIAEDEFQTRYSLTLILKRAGFKVTAAENGEEALALVAKALETGSTFDLLITDILMPRMTGVELLDALIDRSWQLPTLVITGYGDKDTVIELLRRDCADFLDKPFDEATVLKRVDFILKKKAQTAGTTREKQLSAEKAELERLVKEYQEKFAALSATPPGPVVAVLTPAPVPGSELTVSQEGQWWIIRVPASPSEALWKELSQMLLSLLDTDITHFRFDFEKLTDLDSRSLGVLAGFSSMLKQRPGQYHLEVYRANSDLRLLLRMTRLDEVYHLV